MSETTKAELPGGVESQIAEYAIEYPGGRADDVMFHLTTPDGRYMGYLTLGWLREHTSVGDCERALLAGEDDDDT